MLISGIEKFSMVDFGDKISCTVFTPGCNFRCPFCQNGGLVTDAAEQPLLDEEKIFDYLKLRRGLVDAVCVTGGEATLQAGLDEFFARAHELGYITKLDSNGLKPDVIESLLDDGLVDYVAMDIKNSPAKYAMTCGLPRVDLATIERSIRLIMDKAKDYEFRTTIIKEFHTAEDFAAMAQMIKGAKRYYMQKYKDSEGCISHGYTAIEKPEAEEYAKLFEGKVDFVGYRGFN